MQSWEAAWKAVTLNPVQSRYWQPKAPEELYDITADPHNIHNLADDPAHQQVLERMRNTLRDWQLQTRDAGMIPESRLEELSHDTTIYAYAACEGYPLERVVETAWVASSRDSSQIGMLIKRFKDPSPRSEEHTSELQSLMRISYDVF